MEKPRFYKRFLNMGFCNISNRMKSPGFISDLQLLDFWTGRVSWHCGSDKNPREYKRFWGCDFSRSAQSLEKPRFYKRFWQVCCLCHCLAYHVLQDRWKSRGFISDLDRWVFHNIVQFPQSPKKPRFYKRFLNMSTHRFVCISQHARKAQVL